ncbi:MAG: glycoside hydrolase family 16 protein [Paludibacter sp.]
MFNKIILTFFLIISTFASAQNYKLVWEDNFNKSSINKKNWTINVDGNGGGNRELQYYRKQNVCIEKEPTSGANCLVITAKKQNYKSKPATSGRLSTIDKQAFKFGKIEARIKMPKTANGLWPAFWMLGADQKTAVWPKCGEIDIVEMGKITGIENGTQDRYFNGACHWGESWNGGSYPNKGISTTNSYSLQDDFHTYTLFWTPDSITMFLDLDKYPNAKPYYEIPITGTALENETSRYFRKPFYIIFNLAVGGTFSEIYDIKEITALDGVDAKMYIDYVRVYQQD